MDKDNAGPAFGTGTRSNASSEAGDRGGGGGIRNRRSKKQRDNKKMAQRRDFEESYAQIEGSTTDLPDRSREERKFTSKSRVYVGNFGDLKEDDLKKLFEPFGEVDDVFINKEKGFAFLKLDYYYNAHKAIKVLDGEPAKEKGPPLRVRFAPSNCGLKVSNIPEHVSNELLEFAFSRFGEVERALVFVDEKRRPSGIGLVEFMRKPGLMNAVRKCTDHCLFLTASLQPVLVEPSDFTFVCNDGLPERHLNRSNDYFEKRSVGPRLSNIGSYEHEYGVRWKELNEQYRRKKSLLKKEYDMERGKLESQSELIRFEQETQQLRRQLEERERAAERQRSKWERAEREFEEHRRMLNEPDYGRQDYDLQEEHYQKKRRLEEEEMRRRRMDEQDIRRRLDDGDMRRPNPEPMMDEEELRRQQQIEEEEMLRRRLLEEDQLRMQRMQQEEDLMLQARQLTDMLVTQEEALIVPNNGTNEVPINEFGNSPNSYRQGLAGSSSFQGQSSGYGREDGNRRPLMGDGWSNPRDGGRIRGGRGGGRGGSKRPRH